MRVGVFVVFVFGVFAPICCIAMSKEKWLETQIQTRPNEFEGIQWPSNVSQYSGYIAVNNTYKRGANLFYWGFSPNHDPTDDAPLLFWFTGTRTNVCVCVCVCHCLSASSHGFLYHVGGPGCSSELALFAENGPFKLSPSGVLSNNPYSWNDKAWLFYVDQPVGTGFSYSLYPQDHIHNEDGVAADMYQFFLQLFQRYPFLERTTSGAARSIFIR